MIDLLLDLMTFLSLRRDSHSVLARTVASMRRALSMLFCLALPLPTVAVQPHVARADAMLVSTSNFSGALMVSENRVLREVTNSSTLLFFVIGQLQAFQDLGDLTLN